MTITKQIESARRYLRDGNGGAYARSMSGAIRAAASDRAANAFRKAIAEDGAEGFFDRLNTVCPIAR